jgi:hypothetical protein
VRDVSQPIEPPVDLLEDPDVASRFRYVREMPASLAAPLLFWDLHQYHDLMQRPSLHYPTWKANRLALFVGGVIVVGLTVGWLLTKADTAKTAQRA